MDTEDADWDKCAPKGNCCDRDMTLFHAMFMERMCDCAADADSLYCCTSLEYASATAGGAVAFSMAGRVVAVGNAEMASSEICAGHAGAFGVVAG